MEQVIIPEGKALNQIESLLHIDQSVRIQTVRKEDNDLFYQLMRSFYKTSGIPALLNTSFNENEPIINSPLEAIRCFQRTELDYLIMGKILIKNKNEMHETTWISIITPTLNCEKRFWPVLMR